jgi:hypothetical protein
MMAKKVFEKFLFLCRLFWFLAVTGSWALFSEAVFIEQVFSTGRRDLPGSFRAGMCRELSLLTCYHTSTIFFNGGIVMTSDPLFPGLATGIGSLPHKDMEAALELVFEHLPDCPHWPQLQSLRYTEKMEVQPVEGLPGIRHQPEKKSVYVDTAAGEDELADFYEKAVIAEEGGDLEPFAMSPDYAEGFHAFMESLSGLGRKLPLVKAQLIGPFSFGFTITDQEKRAVIFHDVWGDVCMKVLALKSLWQIKKLGQHADRVLFFLDEPMLSAYGSTAMLTVSREEVVTRLNQVIDPLREAGAIVGAHCCGNTDWGLVMESNIDMVNFDAYNFGGTLGIYAREANAFLERGGWFAAGIVPTAETIDNEDEQSLGARLNDWTEVMIKSGVDEELLKNRTVITPACGCGTMKAEQAEKIYRVLSFLQRSYGG